MCELASGCRLPISYLPKIVLNPLKSNWHLTVRYQLPIHRNVRIGIWLPFADFLFTSLCLKASEIELAFDCPLQVANSWECANWHLAATCRFPIYLKFLKSSEIESASGCQPVANSFELVKLTSDCRLPVSYKDLIVVYPIKSKWHLAASCQLQILRSK